jgi:hypothetical protein
MTKRYTPGPPDDEKRRAIRRSEADLVSAWDNYAAAIDAAKGGDQTRLLNLLRGHRPLEDADRTRLADYIATFPGGQGLLRAPPLGEQDFDILAHFIVAMNRGRGRYRDEDVRAVARTAEALKTLARGVAEALKPHLPRLGQRMRDLDLDLDLEPENEEYKTVEATTNLAQDPDDAAIDRAIELEIGQLPDDEREVLRDKIRSRLNRPLARRY